MRSVVLIALLAPACKDTEPVSAGLSEAELRNRNRCEVREAGSRWVPGNVSYRPVAGFGDDDSEYLIDLMGLSTSPTGELLAYDMGSTRVVRLDTDLEVIGGFGREGRGPGEFRYQRVGLGDWITADDSTIYILTSEGLLAFDQQGDFKENLGRGLPRGSHSPVSRIAASGDRVIYAIDWIGRTGRALQTWQFEPLMPHTLLRSDTLPTPPKVDGRIVRATSLIYQADPLWAAHKNCLFISDGAGDWVLRIDLETNRADTLYLPDREIPEPGEEDEERRQEGQRVVRMLGVPRLEGVEPTARLKWSDLTVDPDGYLWLAPWRPLSAKDDPLTVWIIDPATAAVDSVVVERFPEAFLAGPSLVSRVYDEGPGLTLLRKYIPEPLRPDGF